MEHCREVLDSLPEGVVIADHDQRVVAMSTLAGQMLGVDPDHAIDLMLDEVLNLQDRDGRGWVSCNRPYDGLATRTAVPEQSWLLDDGTEVLVMAKIIRPALDQPISRVVISIRSGRGRARLDRERSDLVATIAHELRSPLTGVKGFVQAMLNRWDKLGDEQKKLMLTTVSSDSDRLARLIAELLDVARIDTGRLQLHRRPGDAAALIGRVVASARVGHGGRVIEVENDSDLPAVLADPDKFTQVFTNLVENALRHGDGTVTVRLEPVPASAEFEHGGVSVSVDDEGEGIAAHLRRTVFTKFWKTGSTGGSGLGLYVVNGLVRAHGGTTTIDDAPGGGARIVVIWPAADTD